MPKHTGSIRRIERTAGFRTLVPSVQHWLRTLECVTHKGITAWVNESWAPIANYYGGAWADDDIVFLLDLFRLPTRDVRDWESDLDDDRAAVVREWLGQRRPGRSGRRTLFSIHFGVDRVFDSSAWSWHAAALTPDLALFCLRGEEDAAVGPFSQVFGVIHRRDLVASAALLLASQGYKDETRFTEDDFPFHELSARGIGLTDVYRLLLAHSGYGGRRIATMPSKAVAAFRDPDMMCGFDRIQQIFRESVKPRSMR